jgi:hypothetical protein
MNMTIYVGIVLLTAVGTISPISWDITPCSLLKVNRRFGGKRRLHLQGRRISQARNQRESSWQSELSRWFCLFYYSTVKMEATCSSKTSVDSQRNTRRCIPEDRTLHNHLHLCRHIHVDLQRLVLSLQHLHMMLSPYVFVITIKGIITLFYILTQTFSLLYDHKRSCAIYLSVQYFQSSYRKLSLLNYPML